MGLTRRDFIKRTCTASIAAALPTFPQSLVVEKRPNVVIIITDDQGWGDLSIHGNKNVNTPNIDSLAKDGVTFDRFYVCPVCAPTRAELLTGRYHPRGGVHGVTRGAERLNLDEKTIGDTFKAAGYATAAFGKWHNGTQYPYHPNARGFDEFYGFCSGHWGLYFSPILEHNGKIVKGDGYITDDLTNHALSFIEQNKDTPFFCYLPFNTPHSPWQVPERFYNKYKNSPIQMRYREPEKENIETTRCALAMCENIDWNVGRVLKKLDQLNLSERTFVVYLSDNGPNSNRWNGGMRGRKGSTDEGGVRVPCFMRWPAQIQSGKQIPYIAGAIDLLPTLADLANIQVVGTKPLDGISLKPLLLGNANQWPDRMIFSHQKDRISVRTQQYRLDHTGQLFNMVTDPGQNRDISEKEPVVKRELEEAVIRWKAEVFPKTVLDERPFTVGYPEFPTTYLPARDGIPVGNIRRSAKSANCTFFTNWTSTRDEMTWDIEVANSGVFEALIYYTCSVENINSLVELSFRDNRIQRKVSTPFDPPLVGAEYDRILRTQSYVKVFRPLSMGTIHMEKGRGKLILRALDIPGKQVMDVNSVVLTLKK